MKLKEPFSSQKKKDSKKSGEKRRGKYIYKISNEIRENYN